MDINIRFLVVAYFIGMFIDWIFQWDWQATNKSKWIKSNWDNAMLAVFTHSCTYAILTLIGLVLLGVVPESKQVMVLFTLLISHLIIDTRVPVKWIMKFKGISNEQINDAQNFGFMHIGIDHRLHEMVLLILAILL